jgi:hypothetical protein
MTELQVANLFLPYSPNKLDTFREKGGTGFGLAICKQLTTLLGGHIEVKSTSLHGTTIGVRLPYKPATTPEPSPTISPSSPIIMSPSSMSLTPPIATAAASSTTTTQDDNDILAPETKASSLSRRRRLSKGLNVTTTTSATIADITLPSREPVLSPTLPSQLPSISSQINDNQRNRGSNARLPVLVVDDNTVVRKLLRNIPIITTSQFDMNLHVHLLWSCCMLYAVCYGVVWLSM